jgi:hypothetical protein
MALRCVCRHPDRYECVRLRHPACLPDQPDADYRNAEAAHDDPCDCGCHDEDDEGESDWSDVFHQRGESLTRY